MFKKFGSKFLILALVGCMAVSALSGCGNKSKDNGSDKEEAVVEEVKEQASEEVTEAVNEIAASEDDSLDGMEALEALGNVEVEEKLFDVTVTIPKDFIGEVTQEELDKSVKEKGYESATLNEDGSVTYVMTKAQHKEMLDTISAQINESLSEMIGSENYPNITNIEANENFTSFTVTTSNEDLSLSESMSVLAFYAYGGMYAVFSGEAVDNIHIDFVNEASGQVIKSADSKNLGN